MGRKQNSADSFFFGKILWVENDEMPMQDYIDALRDHGNVVIIAPNITRAIDTIEGCQDIDLALLDVLLPISASEQRQFNLGASGGFRAGVALGRWIREHYPKIKVIGCSVSVDKKVAEWFEDYGNGFALKQSFLDEKDFLRFLRRIKMDEEKTKYLKTFIAHGQSAEEKYALKNYLQNTLGLPEPIILHEQPSLGRTIIEKFEEVAKDVDVVFVLLTPDDRVMSGLADKSISFRARQNVIFELGYFIGRMKRKNGRVILLYKGDLELPTDLSGLVYIKIDNGIDAAGEEIRRELMLI